MRRQGQVDVDQDQKWQVSGILTGGGFVKSAYFSRAPRRKAPLSFSTPARWRLFASIAIRSFPFSAMNSGLRFVVSSMKSILKPHRAKRLAARISYLAPWN